MRDRMRTKTLFEGEARQRRPPPGLKSLLISLNLQMDWLLRKIDEIQNSGDQIIWAEGTTEIERMTLLLEDHRFHRHSGFDVWCIPRVLRQVISLKRVGGISTIEQQLVRTILSRRERTIRRKAREVLLAWILAHRKSKREILRAYLATAYFGYRLRGCDEAAQLLFKKPADELSIEQCAFVASMLVYPLPKQVRYSPSCQVLLPIQDMSLYLKRASEIAPRWPDRIRRRIAYGRRLRSNAK